MFPTKKKKFYEIQTEVDIKKKKKRLVVVKKMKRSSTRFPLTID